MTSIARYSLEGVTLPPVTATLPIAEAMRRALMSRYRQLKQVEKYGRVIPPDAERLASSVFAGKDEQGNFLRDGHSHCFFIRTDDDGDGRIDHVLVYALPDGFGCDEIRAIDSLRWLKCGDLELSLLLVGLGTPGDFRHTRVFAESAVWVSATPFLVTRHMKRRGQKRDPAQFFESPEGRQEFVKCVLEEELDRRGIPREGARFETIECVGKPPGLRSIQFRLERQKPGDDAAARPRGLFRIRFAKPVSGPISLGHSCHFGLGLFLAEPASMGNSS
jgi:CRISPR-associated protein Csb2